MIQAYWSRVVAQLNNIFGLDLELDPLPLLLGFPCKLISNKFERQLGSMISLPPSKADIQLLGRLFLWNS